MTGRYSAAENASAVRPTVMPGKDVLDRSRRDTRLALIRQWLREELCRPVERIEVASADASFRRYFRVFERPGAGRPRTLIVMDAPPEKEDVRPYVKVSQLLERCGVHVPHIHEADAARGLLLLEDLGSTQYLSRLRSGGDPERLYGDALATLADIQVRGRAYCAELPRYNQPALERELTLLPEWFCERHLGLTLAPEESRLLRETFDFLIREALAQPVVLVHRDYHSRNLMLLPERNPGVLDFQDAVAGPLGYDLVSLLKDCYIAWPRERIERWLREYRRMLAGRGLDAGADDREFLRWFDLAGVQRHCKVLGIFARLWYRDGKAGYLADLPLTLEYLRDAAARYAELREFALFVERRIVPRLARANARARRASPKRR
jgi:aminoglycoside/choline kinase family phosphotransferase